MQLHKIPSTRPPALDALFAHGLRNELPNPQEARIKMCLLKKEEPTSIFRGGTYVQYRRWNGAYPDFLAVPCRTAVVVWRSRAALGISPPAWSPDEDQ
jgi:hypothetical protein